MDLRALLRMLGRRWYIVVVGLLATAALGTYVFRMVPPTYEAVGRTLLLPPAGSIEAGGNPFLGLGSLGPSVDILVRYLDADASRLEVARTSPTADYTVSADSATNGPIIVVTAEDQTPEAAISSMHQVLDLAPAALEALQSSLEVPANASIRSMVLTVDVEPETVVQRTLRAVIAAVAAGLVLTFVLTAAVDGLVRSHSRRAQHRRAHAVAADHDPTQEAGSTDPTQEAGSTDPTEEAGSTDPTEEAGSTDLEDASAGDTEIEVEPPTRGSALHR